MTLEQAREALLELAAQQHTNHYRIGQIYNYVVRENLAEKHAKKSAQDYFSEHVKTLSKSVLTTCGAVAQAFTEAACTRYGVYNLHALLAYAKAAELKPSAEEPGPTPIAVPRENGSVLEKPFSECSVEELKLATKHKRAHAPSQPPPEDLVRIQALRDSVARFFTEQSSRTRVNSRVYLGTAYVTVQDVAVKDLEKLAEAVMEGLVSAITTAHPRATGS
jgi:hypothetical protein